jgi:hypothetical protein
MYVHGVDICDFVIYTTKVCAVFHVPRNNNFIDNMISSVTVFFKKCVMPERLTRRLELKKSSVPSSDERLYCLCKSKDNGKSNMIGCDNPKCNLQWFHPQCVKVKHIPKGQWYCPDCKKDIQVIN